MHDGCGELVLWSSPTNQQPKISYNTHREYPVHPILCQTHPSPHSPRADQCLTLLLSSVGSNLQTEPHHVHHQVGNIYSLAD